MRRGLRVGPPPQLPVELFAARRKALARSLGAGQVAVVATHPVKQFSNDVDHIFRPHSDFWYLTGFAEPGAVLALEGGTGRSTLFLRERLPEAEIWTGRRLGAQAAPDALLVDRAFALDEIGRRLPEALRGAKGVHALADHDPAVRRRIATAAGRRLRPAPKDVRAGGPGPKPAVRRGPVHARTLVHAMRSIKDAAELRMLRKACDLGVDAHLLAAEGIRPGMQEYQTEADLLHVYRHAGSTGPGYPAICGCGPNAAVLHYIRNLDPLAEGKLLLVDAGCEWGYYTSDITRTYPVGGRFGKLEGTLYDLVLAAHRAALRKVKPGNRFRDPHDAAVRVLAEGLLGLGYLDGDIDTVLREQTYRRYFMHGTSHFLGLDVHDAGALREPDGSSRVLREGMVLTVEPGLYFNPDFAPCPKGTAGIGIRIEDDVVVTATGHRNLTKRLPVERDGVEALMPRS
ncbi:MAG: Xaa-Pro aminopeptidase [Thermoplasmata archaeon]|nr:Xaa-Pro aminopeptidase [Thermoplasmata archaeon]